MKFSKSTLLAALPVILAIIIGVMISANSDPGKDDPKIAPTEATRKSPHSRVDPSTSNGPNGESLTNERIRSMSGDDWREHFLTERKIRALPAPAMQAKIITLADDLQAAGKTAEAFTNAEVNTYVETIKVLLSETEEPTPGNQ